MQLYANHSVLGKTVGELGRILRKEKTGNLKKITGLFYVQKIYNLYANIFWRNFNNKKSP